MRRLRKGANAVEFGLIMPFLVTILMAIVEYSWYAHRSLALSGAVRDTIRDVAMAEPGEDVVALADEVIVEKLADLNWDGPIPQLTVSVQGASPNRVLKVRSVAPYTMITGFLPMPATIEDTFVARMEDQL